MEQVREIKQVAENAAREAGAYVAEHLNKLKDISYKGGINNLVTDVDLASEKIIKDMIKSRFPSHSILAEEGGEEPGGGSYKWIIDPLDGTTNFAHGFPVFCVSIGVMLDNEVITGIVYDPTRQELFSAEKGKGAFLNGERISVSGRRLVERSLISTGFAYDVEEKFDNLKSFQTMLKSAQAVRRAGSAAIDLCYVACGRFDGFWELGLNPWDTAAGHLMAAESGGRVSTISGQAYDIFKKDILATNGYIHSEMISLLS